MNSRIAKMHFRLRMPFNLLIVAGIFLPLAVFFALAFAPPLLYIFDAALIVGVTAYFFGVLWHREIGFECDGCGKYIAIDVPWICGQCGEKNENTEEFSMLQQCEHCKAKQSSYFCHHEGCRKPVNLFGKDESNLTPARRAGGVDPTPQTARAQRQDEKEEKEHAIELAKLDAELKAFQERQEPKKPKDAKEAVKEEFEREFGSTMAREAFAEEQRAMIDRDYADKPHLRERAHMAIDEFLRKGL